MYFLNVIIFIFTLLIPFLIILPANEALNDYEEVIYINELKEFNPVRVRRSPQGELKVTGSHNDGTNSLKGDLSGTLLKSDKTSLTGNAYYQRNFGSDVAKYGTGGGLQMNHESGLYGTLSYDRQPGSNTYGSTLGYKFGSDKNADASFTGSHSNGIASLRGDISGTILNTGHTTLDGNAYYQRNIGPTVPAYDIGAGLKLNSDRGYSGSVNYNRNPGFSSFDATAGYKVTPNLNTGLYFNRNMGGMNSGNNFGVRLNMTLD